MKLEYAKLIIRFEDQNCEEYFISKEQTMIGRQANNDVVINDDRVSKHHAKIELKDGRYILTDLSSTNGTFVNKRRIDQLELRNDYTIKIGRYYIDFKSEDTISSDTISLR